MRPARSRSCVWSRQLDQSDALLREAAINRLSGYPERGRRHGRRGFCLGLAPNSPGRTRTARRPGRRRSAGLDPWRPATVTEARLKALREWAAKPIATASTPPSGGGPSSPIHAATPEQLADAGREIDRLARRRSGRRGPDPRAAGSTRPGVAAGGPRAIESRRDRRRTRATDRAAVSPGRLRRARAQMARRSRTARRPPTSPPATAPSTSCPRSPHPATKACSSSCSTTPIPWSARRRSRAWTPSARPAMRSRSWPCSPTPSRTSAPRS